MPAEFASFRLIYPPRPKGAINPAMLERYKGFVAQYKYNDIRNLLYLFPDGSVHLYNRHREPHRAYQLTLDMEDSIHCLELPLGKFHVIDGGLMHGKAPGIRDRLVLWDILVHNGEYLVGTTFLERYQLLEKLVGNPTELENETGGEIALQINRNLWLAPLFKDKLAERYQRAASREELEGLVLKNPNGRLEWGLSESNNGFWQIRVRKPHANYSF
jgi:hypothetical protein